MPSEILVKRYIYMYITDCKISLVSFDLQIPSTSTHGAYIRRGDITGFFLRYDFGGLIFGGAYFRIFTVSSSITLLAVRISLQLFYLGDVH